MTLDNITAKSYWHYRIVGWGLYGVAGWLGWINAGYTISAYQSQGLADPLPLVAAIAYTLIQAGFCAYLLSPNTWGEFTTAFQGEVTEAIAVFRGVGRIVAGVLVAAIVVLVAGVSLLSVWADWTSTVQGLGLTLTRPQDQGYLGVLALVLVLGSEVCGLFAHQVLRLGKRHAISQMAESSQLDPALTYSSEHLKAAKQAAKARAKAVGQQWGSR